MNDWTSVETKKPACHSDPDALGTPVLIWPKNPAGYEQSGIDGHAYYGRRATGKPAFYKHGAEIHGVTHWMPMPKGPNVEVTGAARLYRAASGGPQGSASCGAQKQRPRRLAGPLDTTLDCNLRCVAASRGGLEPDA